jgi:nitrate/nitrite transporter NarK
MTGFPSPLFALLQGLLTSVLLLTGPLLYAFGGKLKVRMGDALLMLCTFPALILLSIVVFYPFEGDWIEGSLGPFVSLRSLLVGAVITALGMAWTQRKGIRRRSGSEAMVRIGTAIVIGALWGAIWGFSGWCLVQFGMVGDV